MVPVSVLQLCDQSWTSPVLVFPKKAKSPDWTGLLNTSCESVSSQFFAQSLIPNRHGHFTCYRCSLCCRHCHRCQRSVGSVHYRHHHPSVLSLLLVLPSALLSRPVPLSAVMLKGSLLVATVGSTVTSPTVVLVNTRVFGDDARAVLLAWVNS